MRRRRSTFIKVLIGIVIIGAGLGGCAGKNDGDVFDAVSEEVSAPGDAPEEENSDEAKDGAAKDDAGQASDQEESPAGELAILCVYVCGRVENPGVYTLPEGSRVVDAIECAGGMTADAAETYLNQAALLADGAKLYVPSDEEAEALGAAGREGSDFAALEQEGGDEPGAVKRVNLNTATKEELMALSGIGESKAESILAYRREQGAFKSIDEIKNVSGIGEGIFNRIKDKITIEGQ